MRTKILLSIIIIVLFVNVFGQNITMELTFTAVDNAQNVPLDSIFIENLTQGGDTMLYAPDTILFIDYMIGIGEKEVVDKNTFYVSQNYPNPFKSKTEFNLYLTEKGNIKITGRDILGRELVHYENNLNRGNHSFAFYAGNESYYLLTVTDNKSHQTIKMLNSGITATNGEICKLVYTGNRGNMSAYKSKQAFNNFVFKPGDELQFTGFAKTLDDIVGNALITDTPTTNKNYEFAILKGLRCPGTATVTDIDGNVYNTVQIGSQCWMKENLKTTTYKNNTPIPNVTDAINWSTLTTGAYVWYGNYILWKEPYGALYNWYSTTDANGLCPEGWHVPTDDEWNDLVNFIGGTDSPHGNELKSCRCINSPMGGACNTTNHPRWDQQNNNFGTDYYGFSGLPGGGISYDGGPNEIGDTGFWWSSIAYSSGAAWYRGLYYSEGFVSVFYTDKVAGFSVRCLKN